MLRAQRFAMGLTVEEVAARLLVSPSKVSRVETGQRGASARDIRDFAELYRLSDDERHVLTELAAEGKQRAWWQPFNVPYSTYVGLEAEAVSIRDFALAIVPGLLQTERYAVTMIQAIAPWRSDADVRQQARARAERQARVLRSPGQVPGFTTVIDEAALRRQVGSPDIMHEQLAALRASTEMPNITLRIVPFGAGALPVGTNKFIILGFGRPSMPDVVYLESLTGELILDRDNDVQQYTDAFERVSELSLSPDDSRRLIASIELGYRP